MDAILKPTKRTRDPTVFAAAPVTKPAAKKMRARYAALQQGLLDRGMPIRMVRYITQHFHSRAAIDAFVLQYQQGCHLTGRPLADRYDPKTPAPDACIPRKDGTLVCYAAHLLTHNGEIPDALLLAGARALVAHADRQHRPRPRANPTPPPKPTPQEPDDAGASFLNLGGGSSLLIDDGDLSGPDHAAVTGASIFAWDDARQAMVRTPI